MELTQLLTLAGLALVDSTSFGTLAVPALLLLAQRPQVRVLLTYLATICVFYWAVGLVLVLGGETVSRWVDRLGDTGAGGSTVLTGGQVVVGGLLVAGSFLVDGRAARRRRARREAQGRGPTRRERWTGRLMSGDLNPAAVATVAVLAGLAELATMLPYLGAVAIITGAGQGMPFAALVLAAYVLVMVLPALALTGLRLVLGERARPVLNHLHGWLTRSADEVLGWVIGILGALLVVDGLGRLGVLG